MNRLTRITSRMGAVAAIGALALSSGLSAQAASGPTGTSPIPRHGTHTPVHTAKATTFSNATVHSTAKVGTKNVGNAKYNGLEGTIGSHFLYIDDGGGNPASGYYDIIYVFYLDNTGAYFVQAFPTYAYNYYNAFYGVNTLAIIPPNGARTGSHGYCLAMADAYAEDLQTYFINPYSGAIAGFAGYAYTAAAPSDVKSNGGNYAGVTLSSGIYGEQSGVNTATFGSNCSVRITGYAAGPAGSEFISGAWADATHNFEEPDALHDALDSFAFNSPNGTIYPAAVSSNSMAGSGDAYPDSIASNNGGVNADSVWVGDAAFTPCPDSGYLEYNGFYADQQSACGTGIDGASSWFDGFNYINGNNYSASFDIYSGCCYNDTGMGQFTWQTNVALADPYSYVQDFQQDGASLLVNDDDGNVDACDLAPNYAYACSTIIAGIPVYDYATPGMALL